MGFFSEKLACPFANFEKSSNYTKPTPDLTEGNCFSEPNRKIPSEEEIVTTKKNKNVLELNMKTLNMINVKKMMSFFNRRTFKLSRRFSWNFWFHFFVSLFICLLLSKFFYFSN